MKKIVFKPVFTWSKADKIFRIFRVIYNHGIVGDGKGFSVKLSMSFCKNIFRFMKELHGFDIRILFVRFHFLKSFGGYFT